MHQNKVAWVCIASVVFAGTVVVPNAMAGITYGDGTTKPASHRAVFASAGTIGEDWSSHSGGPASSDSSGYFSGFERDVSASSGPGGFGSSSGYADAFQESSLGEDALSFTMSAAAGWSNYGWAEAGSTLSAWMLLPDETPFYLFRSQADTWYPVTTLQVFREDGSEVDLGFHEGDRWSFAQGTLAGGWYHLSIDAHSVPIWGLFGIPTPGTASLLAMGGLAMTRRRRP